MTDARKREVMIETAQPWYDEAVKTGDPMMWFNAFNHTQNALVAVLENPTGDYAEKLRQRLNDLRSRKD